MKEKMKKLMPKKASHGNCIAIAIATIVIATVLLPVISEAMLSINFSKWVDRGQYTTWEAIPHEVKSKFYDDIRKLRKKHKDKKAVHSTDKMGYHMKYEFDFKEDTVYILSVTRH